jgi:hypothetical protein
MATIMFRAFLSKGPDLTSIIADGLFCEPDNIALATEFQKIDRSMPIVAETEQIADRRNSCLESRAQFSDGSARRFFVVRRKNLRC